MTAYVALLRAVNVGGTKVLMADLKALCEQSGFAQVRTFIASGNVVFASDLDGAKVKAELERRLEQRYGKPIPVMVRTAAELRAVIKASPLPGASASYLLVTFLDQPPPADALDHIRHRTAEEVVLGKREIWIDYAEGVGTSKLVVPAAKSGTARNLNTVKKLAALASELEQN